MEASLQVKNVKSRITSEISARYGSREATWIVRIIFEHVMGWKPVDTILKADYELTPFTVSKIEHITARVIAGEPIQYITGTAPFYGMEFKVTPDVLIPRPETAELIDIIIKDAGNRPDLKVLDCGTGSGCIAISLARNLLFPIVSGIDISDSALGIANENAHNLKVNVSFSHQDIMTLQPDGRHTYDIIVSNPPYIADSEKATMDRNVTEHEPATALFVPDNDPLKYYRAITQYALISLTQGGKLYFEINPRYVNEMKSLLRDFDDVIVTRDSQGRERFITATQPTRQ